MGVRGLQNVVQTPGRGGGGGAKWRRRIRSGAVRDPGLEWGRMTCYTACTLHKEKEKEEKPASKV